MIILDSSFLIAIEVKEDEHHNKAILIRDKIINEEFGEIFISDYIFDETITVSFKKIKDLKKVVEIGEILMQLGGLFKVEEETFGEAWALFKNQKATHFSFTDCTILALMKEKGIRNIATFDKDFKKIKDINVID